jgi:hypothetical protein
MVREPFAAFADQLRPASAIAARSDVEMDVKHVY